jgi:hypothetical protein
MFIVPTRRPRNGKTQLGSRSRCERRVADLTGFEMSNVRQEQSHVDPDGFNATLVFALRQIPHRALDEMWTRVSLSEQLAIDARYLRLKALLRLFLINVADTHCDTYTVMVHVYEPQPTGNDGDPGRARRGHERFPDWVMEFHS